MGGPVWACVGGPVLWVCFSRGRVPVVVFHVLTLAKVSTTNDNNNTKNACK